MKKIFFILAFCFLLTACGTESISISADKTTYSLDTSEIQVTWTNNTDDELIFGYGFWVEKKVDGEWGAIEPFYGELVYEKYGEAVEPNSQKEHIYDISMLKDRLSEGKFRIVSSYMDKNENRNTIYAEFTIE